MKKMNLKFLMYLFIAAFMISSCETDDEKETPSPYIGDYIITKATLTEPINLTTNEAGPMAIPSGTDLTQLIHTALLGAIQCTPEQSMIELRADNTLFLSCDGADELNAGTWEQISATEIKLNMNSTAIPSSPTGIALTVSNIAMANNILSGSTSVPIPKEMIQQILTAMTEALPGGPYTLVDSTPPVISVSFQIQLSMQ